MRTHSNDVIATAMIFRKPAPRTKSILIVLRNITEKTSVWQSSTCPLALAYRLRHFDCGDPEP
jgi:hypothetical protein